MPTQAVKFSRRNVFKRDKMTCQYCGRQGRIPWETDEVQAVDQKQPTRQPKKTRPRRQLGSEELTIDHVVPRAQGGQSSWTNCVLACVDCYSRKADRTPAEAGMRLRKTPTRPTWKPIYAQRMNRIESWSKFISEAYWNVELEQ